MAQKYAGGNPKYECRNPKHIRMFKLPLTETLRDGQDDLEGRRCNSSSLSLNDPFETFEFGISDVFRISKFEFRICHTLLFTVPSILNGERDFISSPKILDVRNEGFD